jgi:hypothetical protein
MKFLAPFFLILTLGGCAAFQPENISWHEKIILVDDAITGAAGAAVVALDAGYITVKEACVVHEYGRLAAVIVDQAWLSLFQQDYDNVEAYLQRAREALAGVSQEAQDRANYHCAGV